MTRSWIGTFLSLFSLVMILSGCSTAPTKTTDRVDNLFSSKIHSVKQVSVITTDGQEIVLDSQTVKNTLPQTTQEIYRSTDSLRESDVRYTVLAYRDDQAPLVIEVGESACQFEGTTYRGVDTQAFYQSIAELTGQALFSGNNPQSIQLSALDKEDKAGLNPVQTQQVWRMIKQAKYQVKPEFIPYPLFPNYKLQLDFGDRIREVSMLTPGLVKLQIGNDVLYYRVPSSLFSLLTKYITPQSDEHNLIDKLFKARGIFMVSADSQEKFNTTFKDPILWESLAHQFVRILKQGVLSNQNVLSGENVKYKITLLIGDTRKEVEVFSSGFRLDGQTFKQPEIIGKLRELVTQYRILEKSN
ncbi:hypothetical protein ACQCN2_13555 [Brevibacillus ginsengisoli]|uniref:hypothetical protein n=1 Tax=Brevibacillus ginsengisoli TaxID=363854 RepID=UPI003CEDB997